MLCVVDLHSATVVILMLTSENASQTNLYEFTARQKIHLTQISTIQHRADTSMNEVDIYTLESITDMSEKRMTHIDMWNYNQT